MNDYQFELPFPPSVNGYWRAFRGRQIISKAGRQYRKRLIEEVSELGLLNESIDCRLSVYISMYPPCKRKRDVDNYLKATLDALTHAGFWVDDEQIDRLCISRKEKAKGGKLSITVRKIT